MVADYELDKAMVVQGHSVTVLTCKDNAKEPSAKEILEGHKVIYFSCIGNIIYGISLGPLFWLLKICILHRKNMDLVWFGGVWNLLTIFGPFICRIFGIKYIITPHGMLTPHLITLRSNYFKNLVIKIFHRQNLSNAHKVHFTVSQEFEEATLATKANITPIIFPLCFDLKRFDKVDNFVAIDKPPKKISLSFIGRITPKKRLDLVFEALKLLPKNLKDKIKFHIIGTDAENLWNNLSYTEENIGVEISYFGALYDNELIEAYHSTDIFVLCSESENFAISVVEAAYSFCVPLITKEVGVSKYFSHKSALFTSLNAIEISSKIAFLVEHPEFIDACKLEARKVSEQFDSSSLSKNYFTNLLG